MKTTFALIMVALLTFSVSAQEKNRSEKRKPLKNLSAEQKASLMTKKMTLHLDLTAQQQTKIEALHTANIKSIETRRKELKEKKEKRKEMTSEERYALANEKLDAQIEMKNTMRGILNDEQFAKWKKTVAHKGKRRMGKRKAERRQQRKH